MMTRRRALSLLASFRSSNSTVNYLHKVNDNSGSWCKLKAVSAAVSSRRTFSIQTQRVSRQYAIFDTLYNDRLFKPNVGSLFKAGCYRLSSKPALSTRSDPVDVEDQPPSWLFVSPAVAGAYGAQVNVDLDLAQRLSGESLQALRENVKSRGLIVDIDGLLQNFKTLLQMQEEKAVLGSQKEKMVQQLKLLKETGSTDNSEELRNRLREKLRSIKSEIAALKSSWELEERVMLAALGLPNQLHRSTPLNDSAVLREASSSTNSTSSLSHVEIAQKFDLIKFR
ncbi:hypothetical protein EGW08_012903 [Elysia chlorotica]|uniref:Serine-tRNA synthetase type1 N-terminal domain-containing protein n=1 Tax=Elysia chlorotica TaxID=188477 RepID=A0A3S1B420_ELYCH|nr:hypothetical protein EGW08_012903 [Elysia chlorotica]